MFNFKVYFRSQYSFFSSYPLFLPSCSFLLLSFILRRNCTSLCCHGCPQTAGLTRFKMFWTYLSPGHQIISTSPRKDLLFRLTCKQICHIDLLETGSRNFLYNFPSPLSPLSNSSLWKHCLYFLIVPFALSCAISWDLKNFKLPIKKRKIVLLLDLILFKHGHKKHSFQEEQTIHLTPLLCCLCFSSGEIQMGPTFLCAWLQRTHVLERHGDGLEFWFCQLIPGCSGVLMCALEEIRVE